MDNYNKLKEQLEMNEIEVNGQSLYYDKIYNNCCLLNSVSLILKKNGVKIIKDGDDIDDSIVIYNFLKQKEIKMYELGESQQDNILEYVSEIFNINICMYDRINNIINVYKNKNKEMDYLRYIIIYVGGHFNIGEINIKKDLEEKIEIIKQLNITIIEIEK